MKQLLKTTFLTIFFSILFATCLFGFLGLVIWAKIPSAAEIKGCLVTTMFNVELCPGSAQYVRLSQISNSVEQAVLISEDSAFFSHNGFDLAELQKSFEKNLKEGRFARGGSTITQQLAKNVFLNSEKTIARKVFEALITIKIEKTLSKKEILERYLNVVQFGKNIFGIKAGAYFYFKKHPSELTVLESAWMAFLLPNPEVYSKSFYRKKLTPFAQRRLLEIVNRLELYNRISPDEASVAKSEIAYFLTGLTPPAIDPQLDQVDEESTLDLEL